MKIWLQWTSIDTGEYISCRLRILRKRYPNLRQSYNSNGQASFFFYKNDNVLVYTFTQFNMYIRVSLFETKLQLKWKSFFFLNNDNVYTLTQFIYVYIIWERDRWCQYNQEMLLMVHEAITMKIVIIASRYRVSQNIW